MFILKGKCPPIFCFLAEGSDLFAGAGTSGVFRSTDNGRSWTNLTSNSSLLHASVYSLVAYESGIFAGSNDGVYRSMDNGESWTQVDSGMSVIGNSSPWIPFLTSGETDICAGTTGAILVSRNNGAIWINVVSSTEGSSNFIFVVAMKDSEIVLGSDSGIFVSVNNGSSWVNITDNITDKTVNWMLIVNNELFVETADYAIWRRPI